MYTPLHKSPGRKETLMEQEYKKLKESYIESIKALMEKCDDISLLDLIQKLLEKSM